MKKLKLTLIFLITFIMIFSIGCTNNKNGCHTDGEDYELNEIVNEDNISLSVNFLERRLVNVDDEFYLTIVVENKSEYILSFVHGSSSNELPEALSFELESGIKLPELQEGAFSTLDFWVTQLNPGESETFYVTFIATESGEHEITTILKYNLGSYTEEGAQITFVDEEQRIISFSCIMKIE